MLRGMFLNPGPHPLDLLNLIVVGLGIVGLVVGLALIWRITHVEEDGDDHWRFGR